MANLDCSDAMKAYIACNYELEKAMNYLVEELEKAGKLEKKVIFTGFREDVANIMQAIDIFCAVFS